MTNFHKTLTNFPLTGAASASIIYDSLSHCDSLSFSVRKRGESALPSSTFFRLPEEKRARLLEAAWEEALRVRFAEISINRIIHRARIPRGSFYQYFSDKDDLVRYLFEEVREYFASLLGKLLHDSGGDLFAVPVRAFDRLMGRGGESDPMLHRCIQIFQLNPGMDFQNFLPTEADLQAEEFLGQADSSRLRGNTMEYVIIVFSLLVAALAVAVMRTLQDPEEWERQRADLQTRVEIVRYGSLRQQEGVKV